jgi:hypothetical protein
VTGKLTLGRLVQCKGADDSAITQVTGGGGVGNLCKVFRRNGLQDLAQKNGAGLFVKIDE